jgi:hypothetical protein
LNGTSSSVGEARAEVVELALGFLGFAFSILLGTWALEILLLKMLAQFTPYKYPLDEEKEMR